jgi:hypothetical protein
LGWGAVRLGALELSPAILADGFSRVDLMFFLTRLYTRLQQLGTVGAVDLAAYAQPLQSD